MEWRDVKHFLVVYLVCLLADAAYEIVSGGHGELAYDSALIIAAMAAFISAVRERSADAPISTPDTPND